MTLGQTHSLFLNLKTQARHNQLKLKQHSQGASAEMMDTGSMSHVTSSKLQASSSPLSRGAAVPRDSLTDLGAVGTRARQPCHRHGLHLPARARHATASQGAS